MSHDMKPSPMSPSKGKAKERRRSQYDWWDFQLLAERTQRPLEWSQSSIIFTAHPTQPLVTGRHVLSSKQFVLPSPAPVISSPASYEPPTVISVDPRDDWLFAYFPGQNDGTACLWMRGTQIDDWNVREWWSCATGAGVVAARWLGSSREWLADPVSASHIRLPPRGPFTPVSGPTLLLVTQNHMVKIYYYRHYNPSLQIIRCSLNRPGIASEGRPYVYEDIETTRRCFRAAIGLNYDDASILIATRSHLFPLSSNVSQTADLDSTSSGELERPVVHLTEGEPSGEESVVNITEVQLRFNGSHMGIIAEPLPPIPNVPSPLISLNFISPYSDASKSSSDEKERGQYFLVSISLEFGDHTSNPKSELVVHTVARKAPTPNTIPSDSTWIYRKLATRSFGASVLVFVAPCCPISTSSRALVYAGLIDAGGALPQSFSSEKLVRTGEIRVLNLSDLADNSDWETTPIMSSVHGMGQNVPLNTIISPNGVLASMLSSSLWPIQTWVQLLPRPKHTLDLQGKHIPHLALGLSRAILTQNSAADIIHLLSLPTTPIADVFSIIYHMIRTLESQGELAQYLTHRVIGEVMSIYRKRALETTQDKEDLEARWKTAHDLCSLIACNAAFEDCKEGEAYDLDAVWQLISLSTWVVGLTERVMKECVLFSLEVLAGLDGDLPSYDKSFNSPLFLHLSHPFALQKFSALVAHVRQYRAYLGSLSAKGQNAQIARGILSDLIDNSGVDFKALESVLTTSLSEARTIDKDDCLKALATCQPTPGMQPFLVKIIRNLTQSALLHKPTLFIKPSDMMDDVEGLLASSKKNKARDVILKRVLSGDQVTSATCIRCGGQSEVGTYFKAEQHISTRWRVWEKMWMRRCICGGEWARTDN